MNLLEAVANWHGCPYGLKRCQNDCDNYFMVDPRPTNKGVGPGPKGQRTICSLFEDINSQIMEKTDDCRLSGDDES